jgi:hypothetical protein
MRILCLALISAVGMALCAPAQAAQSASPPRISKPRPAPATPPPLIVLPPAIFDPTLVVNGQDIKGRAAETRLSVDVRVNGRGPYRFIVDSGADTSVIGLRVAQDLQLPLGTPTVLNGMTSRNTVDRVRVAQINLGLSTVNDLQLPALREVNVGGDGLLGIDALAGQRLMMDFERHVIRVEDARIPEKHYFGEIVVIARRKRGQLILAHVAAGGVPLDAVIDTGSEVTIGNLALRKKLWRRQPDKFFTATAIGVTGEPATLQLALLDELHVGPVILRNVPVAFADVPPFALFGLSEQPALLLGTDILEKFRRVSLDFRARRVRFQLRSCGPKSFYMDNSVNYRLTRLIPTGSIEACAR